MKVLGSMRFLSSSRIEIDVFRLTRQGLELIIPDSKKDAYFIFQTKEERDEMYQNIMQQNGKQEYKFPCIMQVNAITNYFLFLKSLDVLHKLLNIYVIGHVIHLLNHLV